MAARTVTIVQLAAKILLIAERNLIGLQLNRLSAFVASRRDHLITTGLTAQRDVRAQLSIRAGEPFGGVTTASPLT